ncbi:hypothetical protein [Geobacter sp. DSM 9736]|uniref:hypothetical protein n=1 Tax=Geobacter sp. DSM 9736 TaxID=1277350 RepID=UPI000B5107D3|nr:hypothetical protein [Geobacter sp. DSM 9736]SNB47979.1 Multicopper oxidase [Geobacter sp. DSM 9736]
MNTLKKTVPAFLLGVAALLGSSGISIGAEYWLRAQTFTKTMPDSSVVTMWGFAQCTDGTYSSCGAPTSPGPVLSVPPTDAALTVHLRNALTGPLVEPVSIVIPGQRATMAPVKFTDGEGRQRVKSFTTETPPDNSTTNTYSWPSLRPGTYLYQSGTHPAVQVQMGLYGAVIKNAAAGQAYGPASAFDAEALLVFSEIDPVLHGHVAAGTYGTEPPAGITSTIDYEPKYFLINGQPYPGNAPIPAGIPGQTTLLRFLNAGLKTHVPLVQGLNLSVIAEDGSPYGHVRKGYSVLLPPAKTSDALMTSSRYGTYPLYDRKLSLTNGASYPGGLIASLVVPPESAESIGVFRNGEWFIDVNGNGAWDAGDTGFWFGLTGDQPVIGDWNGSGTKKVGIVRGGNQWFLDVNGNRQWDPGIDAAYTFGTTGDIPVAGDWTGAGTARIGVFRSGQWLLDTNGNGIWEDGTDFITQFGNPGDKPVTGDWTGSGTTYIGVIRGNTWFLDLNGNGYWDEGVDGVYSFGIPSDKPVTGDWTGTGVTRIGVVRGSTWFLDLNGNGAWDDGIDGVFPEFGIPTDVPVAGRW